MSPRLERQMPNESAAPGFPHAPCTTKPRAPDSIRSWCSGLIQVESAFRKYAVSTRRRARLHAGDAVLGRRRSATAEHNLFHLRTNLRYGCTILRHYLDIETRQSLPRAGPLQRQPRPARVSQPRAARVAGLAGSLHANRGVPAAGAPAFAHPLTVRGRAHRAGPIIASTCLRVMAPKWDFTSSPFGS